MQRLVVSQLFLAEKTNGQFKKSRLPSQLLQFGRNNFQGNQHGTPRPSTRGSRTQDLAELSRRVTNTGVVRGHLLRPEQVHCTIIVPHLVKVIEEAQTEQ